MSVFSDLVAEHLTRVFLNPEKFGEQVTYQPRNGGVPRAVSAVVMEPGGAPGGRRRLDEPADAINTLDEIDVVVGRDPSAAHGGIADPQIGDAIARSGDEDLWSFSGMIVQEDSASWTLRFQRRRKLQQGRQQVMR